MKQCKPKPCKECKTIFQPRNSLQVVCGLQCAVQRSERKNKEKVAIGIKKERKAQKQALRVRKEALKSNREWLKELQAVVNKYVRLRDSGKPCCSCDKPDDGSHQRHASHYKSAGSNSALRFNLWNIHASCSVCNNHLSGNIGEYTPRLIKKIGQDRYDWLLTQNQPVKYDIEYIKRFKKIFLKRIRMIEKRL
jgi:5-methylcytosine-specific restriction endonuclease McrA